MERNRGRRPCFSSTTEKNKLSTCFNKTPYVVTHRHGSQITARNKDDHSITRNVSHFKKIPNILETETDDDDHRQPQQQHRQLQQQQQHGQRQRLPLRRSTRLRRQPERYGQSIPSEHINGYA